jgi:hypothetical protein
MKKLLLLSVLFVFAGIAIANAQDNTKKKPHPIPSFKTEMIGQDSWMDYNPGGNKKEKRDVNIRVTTSSYRPNLGDAKVYVVKSTGYFLGPFWVAYGEVLTVPVDWGQWGVSVNCGSPILVDVWFSTGW